MPAKLHLEPKRRVSPVSFSVMSYSRRRGEKVQASLDKLFGKRPDAYGQWQSREPKKLRKEA